MAVPNLLVAWGSQLPHEPVRANPNLSKVQLFGNFAGGNLIGASIAFHPAGEACGNHNHRGGDELFIVLAGTGIITVEDVQYKVRADDAVLVRAGVEHNLTGTSQDEPFKVACIFAVAPGKEGDEAPWQPTTDASVVIES